MQKNRASFNYNKLDSTSQVFLQQKEKEIKLLLSQKEAEPNNLQIIYTIGKKLAEVRDASNKCLEPYFLEWFKNEVLKEFPGKKQGTNRSHMSAYNYIYLYNYTSEYLSSVADLNANLKITQSALYTLGLPGTSDEIKQKFARIARLGKVIRKSHVDQAIKEERTAKVKSGDNDLDFGSDHCIKDETNNTSTELAIRTHTKAQGMLAKLGRELGYLVWIAPDNRSEIWQKENFADLSINELPKIGTDPTEQKIIPYLDVIWLGKNKSFKAVFEIECTTSIYSGLLRMTDLMELYSNLNFSFYMVVPEARVKKVKEQLSRPTFRAFEIHKKCKWLVVEELEKYWEEMMKWGENVNVINRIAYSLTDE